MHARPSVFKADRDRGGRPRTDKGVTAAQLALAWVLHQGQGIVPIPGTKRVSHLEENLAASQVRLSTAELARIDQRVPAPAGDRYDPAGMRGVDL